ncbi:hypothetical protein LTR86_009562 [Recurvomyces mirabilis]|nr:hypothetical protein LTR86_009562 [Recurvomyces mirabilis]
MIELLLQRHHIKSDTSTSTTAAHITGQDHAQSPPMLRVMPTNPTHASNLANKASSLPTLPPEVWHRILRYHGDPQHLWRVCRIICASWHAEVPKIFASQILQDPSLVQLTFNFKWRFAPEREDTEYIETALGFDRFDPEDQQRCVFTELSSSERRVGSFYERDWALRVVGEEDRWSEIARAVNEFLSGHESDPYHDYDDGWPWTAGAVYDYLNGDREYYHDDTYDDDDGHPDTDYRVPENERIYRRRINVCPHLIRIGREVNDTVLPALRVHKAEREISFEWQGMLAGFLRESDKVLRRLTTVLPAPPADFCINNVREFSSWATQLFDHEERTREEVRKERIDGLIKNADHPCSTLGNDPDRGVYDGYSDAEYLADRLRYRTLKQREAEQMPV